MKIRAENTFSFIEEGTDGEVAWLDHILSFPNRQMIIRKFGDGRVHLLSPVSKKFPTGLIPLVRATSRAEGASVEIVSERVKPCEPDPTADLGWLHDYQLDAVHAVWKYTRGVIHMPPAAGKGEIDVAIAASLPCPWLMLVHRAQLAADVASRFEKRTGQRAGYIGEGQWTTGKRLTCATFQTMYAALQRGDRRALELLEGVQGLLVDECHSAPATTFMRVVVACKNAYFRVGLSATPLTHPDEKDLWTIGLTGPVIYPPNDDYKALTARLIEKGVISAPKIRMVTVRQEIPPGLTWMQMNQQFIVDSAPRNLVLQAIMAKAAKPGMVFVGRKAHGQILVRLAERAGLRVQWMDGSSDIMRRQAEVKRLGRNDLDLIVATPILDTGIDLPPLVTVINASGGASSIATIQRMGRGARVTETKRTFSVYDINDKGHRWLSRHSTARRKAYEAEGYQVETTDVLGAQASLL